MGGTRRSSQVGNTLKPPSPPSRLPRFFQVLRRVPSSSEPFSLLTLGDGPFVQKLFVKRPIYLNSFPFTLPVFTQRILITYERCKLKDLFFFSSFFDISNWEWRGVAQGQMKMALFVFSCCFFPIVSRSSSSTHHDPSRAASPPADRLFNAT